MLSDDRGGRGPTRRKLLVIDTASNRIPNMSDPARVGTSVSRLRGLQIRTVGLVQKVHHVIGGTLSARETVHRFFNWTVSKSPVIDGDGQPSDRYYKLQRDDTRELLGTVGKRYQPLHCDGISEGVLDRANPGYATIAQFNIRDLRSARPHRHRAGGRVIRRCRWRRRAGRRMAGRRG